MKSFLAYQGRRFIQRYQASWLVTTAMRIARNYCEAYYHPGYDSRQNGEYRVLRLLSSTKIKTVFDVGANQGDWSAAALEIFPEARVEAFEPVPATVEKLTARLQSSRLRVHACGLGREEATVPFFYYGPDHSFLSSAVHHTHIVPGTELRVPIRRGETVAHELGCTQIDYLKLDVEGMEYDALLGFLELLAAGRVGVIQFEHHGGHRPLKDFHTLLEPLGFRIGKIYARRVDFYTYDRWAERYVGPNYLAIRAADSATFSRLMTPSG